MLTLSLSRKSEQPNQVDGIVTGHLDILAQMTRMSIAGKVAGGHQVCHGLVHHHVVVVTVTRPATMTIPPATMAHHPAITKTALVLDKTALTPLVTRPLCDNATTDHLPGITIEIMTRAPISISLSDTSTIRPQSQMSTLVEWPMYPNLPLLDPHQLSWPLIEQHDWLKCQLTQTHTLQPESRV